MDSARGAGCVRLDWKDSWRRVSRLLGSVLAAGVLSALIVVATPTAEAASGDVTVGGHGYGHGRGMGQWGAYGYATQHGWSYEQILSHFYGGTTVGNISDPWISVRLTAVDNRPLRVISSVDYSAGPVRVPGGQSAELTHNSDGSWQLTNRLGCDGPPTVGTRITDPVFRPYVWSDTFSEMLTLCGPEQRSYRGNVGAAWDGAQRSVNYLPIQQYLRGVVPLESPASWGDAAGGAGMQALMAQAVAARSYGWAESRTSYARTCDTTSCQVYGGAALNGISVEDRRTDNAIIATYGEIRSRGGAVVRTEFSSSTGGYTAGGDFPAVPDDGDAASPHHNWTTLVSADRIGSAFGVGHLRSVTVLSRNGLGADGGRVLIVRVSGSTKTVEVTGSQFRSSLDLKSDWFTVGEISGSLDSQDAGVAAVRTSVGTLIPFVRGTDGAIYYTVGRADRFSAWTPLPGGLAVSAPTAVSWDGSRIDVFVVGTDSALWQTITTVDSQGQPTGWSAWYRLGGVLASAPSVASVDVGVLSLAARGTDSGLWQLTFDGASWSPWMSLGGVSALAPSMEAISAAQYLLRVVATDGTIWARALARTGGAAGPWTGSGLPSSRTPSVSGSTLWARPSGVLSAVNTAGSLVQVRGAGPHQVNLGGLMTSATATVEWPDSRVTTFGRGSDFALWMNTSATTNASSAWTLIGGRLI